MFTMPKPYPREFREDVMNRPGFVEARVIG